MSLQPRSALMEGQRDHSLVKAKEIICLQSIRPVLQWGVPTPTMVHTFSTVTHTCVHTQAQWGCQHSNGLGLLYHLAGKSWQPWVPPNPTRGAFSPLTMNRSCPRG